MLELAGRMAQVPERYTIADVEAWASERGLTGFSRGPNPSEIAALSDAWWPVPLAAAWILEREPEAAANSWAWHKHWGRKLWEEQPWHEAADSLWRELKSGRVAACGRRRDTTGLEAIGSAEWQTLTWERRGSLDIVSRQYDHRAAFLDVLVDAQQVKRSWPAWNEARRQATAVGAETACRRKLERLMRERPNEPMTKAELGKLFPGVSKRGFDRAFRTASNATGSAWSAAGRRRTSSKP